MLAQFVKDLITLNTLAVARAYQIFTRVPVFCLFPFMRNRVGEPTGCLFVIGGRPQGFTVYFPQENGGTAYAAAVKLVATLPYQETLLYISKIIACHPARSASSKISGPSGLRSRSDRREQESFCQAFFKKRQKAAKSGKKLVDEIP